MLIIKLAETRDINPIDNSKNRWKFTQDFIAPTRRKRALYIHTPFCPTKCKYCKWATSPGHISDVSNHWINRLPNQVQQYKEIFDNVIFDEVYFGGGTPTFTDAANMEYLFDNIPNFDKIKNKCMEASPNTLTTEHLYLLRSYNFNFLSIGIQTLDPMIAAKQNRFYLDKDRLKALVNFIKHEYPSLYLNLDMICFMNHGDIRDLPQFRSDIRFLCEEVQPTSITIHQEYNAFQSTEKTEGLMNITRDMCEQYRYECVNSNLSPRDIQNDTIYRAEYKIARENFSYMHHLWDKYNVNLKNQYQVLSLGSTHNHPLASYIGDTIFNEESEELLYGPWDEYPEWCYNYLQNYRKFRHWE